jgi:plastocyanin
MRAIRTMTGSPRARLASAGLVVGGMLAYGAIGAVGATGAADETITAVGNGTGTWDKGSPSNPVPIETGDTVTWRFEGSPHNVASTSAMPSDPRWEPFLYPGPGEFDAAAVGSSQQFTFYKAGEYTFTCTFHPGVMDGKIVVTGADLPIPTVTPTATPTVTTTPTPTPTSTPPPRDDHGSTPRPGPAADTTGPTLSGIKLRGRRRAARVTFTLSENATVTLQVRNRGRKKSLRTIAVQARAGTRSVVIRSSKLREGRRYTVALSARDAMGNLSATSTSVLRIRK